MVTIGVGDVWCVVTIGVGGCVVCGDYWCGGMCGVGMCGVW